MIIQVDGKNRFEIRDDIIRAVLVPGKICNLLTKKSRINGFRPDIIIIDDAEEIK
jgi:hypothetical protein